MEYIVKASHGGVDTVRGLFVIMLCSGFEAGEECEFGVEGGDGVEDAGKRLLGGSLGREAVVDK